MQAARERHVWYNDVCKGKERQKERHRALIIKHYERPLILAPIWLVTPIKDAGVTASLGSSRPRAPLGRPSHGGVLWEPLGGEGVSGRPICPDGSDPGDLAGRSMAGGPAGAPRATIIGRRPSLRVYAREPGRARLSASSPAPIGFGRYSRRAVHPLVVPTVVTPTPSATMKATWLGSP